MVTWHTPTSKTSVGAPSEDHIAAADIVSLHPTCKHSTLMTGGGLVRGASCRRFRSPPLEGVLVSARRGAPQDSPPPPPGVAAPPLGLSRRPHVDASSARAPGNESLSRLRSMYISLMFWVMTGGTLSPEAMSMFRS